MSETLMYINYGCAGLNFGFSIGIAYCPLWPQPKNFYRQILSMFIGALNLIAALSYQFG